jgi:hypothetical protein
VEAPRRWILAVRLTRMQDADGAAVPGPGLWPRRGNDCAFGLRKLGVEDDRGAVDLAGVLQVGP